MTFSGFWARFVASIIDGLAFLLLGIVALVPVYMFGEPGSVVLTSLDFFWLFTAIFYYILMEGGPTQGTLGKMALGMKVTDLQGNRISYLRSTGRYFARIISGVTLLIGYVMCAFHPRKQCLHDIICGTLVLSRKAETVFQPPQSTGPVPPT